jgi:hypothetical protein
VCRRRRRGALLVNAQACILWKKEHKCEYLVDELLFLFIVVVFFAKVGGLTNCLRGEEDKRGGRKVSALFKIQNLFLLFLLVSTAKMFELQA